MTNENNNNYINDIWLVNFNKSTKAFTHTVDLKREEEDTKSGAGQYFTPRALIRAMVECLRPEPMKKIADPAFGTGGFFLAAYDFIANKDNYSLNK